MCWGSLRFIQTPIWIAKKSTGFRLRVRFSKTIQRTVWRPPHRSQLRLISDFGVRPSTTRRFVATPRPHQDSRPAPPEPRESVPNQDLSPRTTRAVTIEGKRHLPQRLTLATFNARTLLAEWRIRELVRLALDLKISILGLQEHRRSSSPDLTLPHGWQFHLAPASDLGSGGIGFLLSPSASHALLDVNFLSDRIGVASFSLRDRRLHVICAHAPTSPRTVQDPQVTDSFYDVLAAPPSTQFQHVTCSMLLETLTLLFYRTGD